MAKKQQDFIVFSLLDAAIQWLWAAFTSAFCRVIRSSLFAALGKISVGQLVIKTDNSEAVFGENAEPVLRATLHVKNELLFYYRVVTQWDLGFAEAFIRGEVDVDDLTAFFTIMLKNRNTSDNSSISFWLGTLWSRIQHQIGRMNTIAKAQENIHEHYDLSNEMFQTFLDPTMMYSCAVFEKPEDSLEQAQLNKLHKIIREANIKETDHVLEIGSGWGSFAIEAVRKTGCRVTTVTISEEQFSLAKQRIAEAGLTEKINLVFLDYRKIEGKFDKVVSIEMIEAVGHDFLPEYFATIDRVLKPDGVAYIQAITFPDCRYEQYRRGCDFIQKYIFPGGLCPSIGAMAQAMTKSSSLQFEHIDNIGIHYARTLRLWKQNFIANERHIKKLGFNDAFIRRWLYYFCYCEAGFETKVLGTLHMLITRPGNESIKHWNYHATPQQQETRCC